ncbi:MAG: DUF523 domain-containing protein [Bacilli bacterium]|nr:DUF523 domain-containing protein [Bacilli bacterium]
MEKILISACLVGDNVKYDGTNNKSSLIDELLKDFELIPFCPEVEGGLSIPRDKSERLGERVVSEKGRDVTRQFSFGAEMAYNICLYLGIKVAILKETSPSCGVHEIYDGRFTHRKIKGRGYTTEYLEQKGIKVISENEIEDFLKEIRPEEKEESK